VVTHSKGFTLLELIIIIAILGITVAFAAPGLITMIKNNRISSSANDFVAALQFAKAESAAQLTNVIICKKNNAETDCTEDGDWQRGWIVFADSNGDDAVNAGDEMILLNHEALDAKITFGGTAGVRHAVTFRPAGTTSITKMETLIMCDDREMDSNARGILITIAGRGNVVKTSETRQTTCL
jgi:type IV fimbrial biogenesis protein FimT